MQHWLHRPAIGLTLLTATSALTAPVLAQSFLVEYADEKLSVEANNIQVKDLLLEIQDKTGIQVNFIADPRDTISLSVSEQTVENVIAKITENHMIIHSIVNGKKTINELIIISEDPELNSGGGGSGNLPTGQPAPAIATVPAAGQDSNQPPSQQPANAVNPENVPPQPTDNAQQPPQPQVQPSSN